MRVMTPRIEAPVFDVDFYSDEFLTDPYPLYRRMRALGPVVRLHQNDGYAITRFADVRDALLNPQVFLSGRGIMMNEPVNRQAAGSSVLNMDGESHRELRLILARPLAPSGLTPLRDEVRAMADTLVADLVAQGRFDGVRDFAHVLPVTLVSRLVGLPEDGREQMLDWASGIFDTIGGLNTRMERGLAGLDGAREYLGRVRREDLLSNSWGQRLFTFVDSGVLTEHQARLMLFDYVAPALDTTINATSAAIWLLGENPDQWDLLRASPELVSSAIEEAVRLESPIRAFSRVLSRDHEVDGVHLPEGARVLLVYASANRDERRWSDPDRYDIRRKGVQEHLGFGTGVHMCAGMHLARLEMRCLFDALIRQVARFEVGAPDRALHNVLRGLRSLEVRIVQ